jgi:hypothetical protein
MSVVAYTRFKFLWGAVDLDTGDAVYTPAQKATLGPSAASGSGVGARRAQLVFTRTPPGTFAEDVAVMHFDFLNLTSGVPDDTWTTGDFTALETAIFAWWTSTKPLVGGTTTFKEIRWYRFGSGVVPPNPPVRITPNGIAGTGSLPMLPPQCSCSLSLHVAPRRSWGRTYIPGLVIGDITTPGTLSAANVDIAANAVHTLVTAAASSDMHLVVYSKHLNALLNVESIAVDNIVDIIRRRRWEHPTYRKQLP